MKDVECIDWSIVLAVSKTQRGYSVVSTSKKFTIKFFHYEKVNLVQYIW